MPTHFIFLFQQVDLWTPGIGAAAVILVVVVGWLLNRKKTDSDIHKTEMDLAMSILARLEPLHIKSLNDEAKIEKLQAALQECVDGRRTCAELNGALIAALAEVEAILEAVGGHHELIGKIRQLRERL